MILYLFCETAVMYSTVYTICHAFDISKPKRYFDGGTHSAHRNTTTACETGGNRCCDEFDVTNTHTHTIAHPFR